MSKVFRGNAGLFFALELKRFSYFKYQILSLISIWLLVAGTLQHIDKFASEVIWLALPVWVLAAQWLLSFIYTNSAQALRLYSRHFQKEQRLQMLAQAIFLHVPSAAVIAFISNDMLLALALFFAMEILSWVFMALFALVSGAGQLLIAQMLYVPMIWPFILFGTAYQGFPAEVAEVFVGLWLILYSFGPHLIYHAFRIGIEG